MSVQERNSGIKSMSDFLNHQALMHSVDVEVTPAQKGGSDWCNVLTWYPVGSEWYANYQGFGHSLFLKFTTNADGTGRVLQIEADGQDFTTEVLAHGGKSIPLTFNSKYSNDCKKKNYYLSWELGGEFAEWIKSKIPASDLLIYADYDGQGNRYFYFWLETWHWASIHPVS